MHVLQQMLWWHNTWEEEEEGGKVVPCVGKVCAENRIYPVDFKPPCVCVLVFGAFDELPLRKAARLF